MRTKSVEIVAEVANAHQGDPETAARIAKAGADGGADAVKFQIYFADELLVRSHPRFEHFRKQAFPADVWPDLIAQAKSFGIRVYCDVFGAQALAVGVAAGADGFKIHTSDLGNLPLLGAVRDTGRPIYISAGGSAARELAAALGILLQRSDGTRPVLMHGYQSFPTPVADACLARLAWLRRYFGAVCDIGYQDHVDGDDPFAVHLPLMALAAGAVVLEKHMTLDRAAKGVDYYSSLEPGEFAAFVRAVRQAEAALGEYPEVFSDSERGYRRTMKKFVVAGRAMAAGETVTTGDLTVKRVAEDAPDHTVEMTRIAGRTLVRAVPIERALTRADVRQNVWATVVARMASTRMPGKAMANVAGMTCIRHLFERLKQAKSLNGVLFCTTTLAEDLPLVREAEVAGIPCFRGSVEDVLGRMLDGLAERDPDVVVRVTGDDILVDPDYLDATVSYHLSSNAEYTEVHALPSGTEVEVFDHRVLTDIRQAARDSSGTEYLTWYVTHQGDQFRCGSAPVAERHRRNWRLTIDTPEDHDVINRLLTEMSRIGKPTTYRMDDIVGYFEAHPEVLKINAGMSKRSRLAKVDTGLDWARFLGDLAPASPVGAGL